MVMLFIIACPYRELLNVRINGGTRLEQKSLNERREYLVQAKDLIKGNLLFGVGTGNYVSALERQDQNKKSIWDYQPVHNVFLLFWAESGIFAFFSFLAFLFFLIKKNRRAVFSGAIFMAIIILLLLDHWLLSLPFGILFLFFILGLI
jgi:O-antigen ligase